MSVNHSTNNPDNGSRQSRLDNTIETLLSALPLPIADAIRIGAISHSLSADLLVRLLTMPVEPAQVWNDLEQLQLAKRNTQGEFRYHDRVRRYFLNWWRQSHPERFQQAQHSALAYFRERWELANELQRPVYQYEILYHLLVVDEAAGLSYLQTQFEEALDRYQPGVAEQYVRQGLELYPTLTPETQAWLTYLQARLDLSYSQGDSGATVFRTLAESAPLPVIRAVAQWSLGVILVNQQQWSQAIQLYKASLAIVEHEQAFLYSIRVMVAIGHAYHDLAGRSGSLSVQAPEPLSRFRQLWYVIQWLPLLCYQWLVHFISILPNWYFGADYQNWIIAYLLSEAVHWYRKAEKQAKATRQPWSLVEIRLALAVLEHQLGRWLPARHRFTALLQLDEVCKSLYRTARVRLEQGQALFTEGKLDQACAMLLAANELFDQVNDEHSRGAANLLLGHIYARLGRDGDAILAYSASMRALLEGTDALARTQVVFQLQDLLDRRMLTNDQRQQIDGLIDQVPEQHYISRFPDALLRRFRRLALLWVLPINYLILMIISWWAIQSLFTGMEMGYRFLLAGTSLKTTLDGSLRLGFLALTPILALWLYHFMYCFSGFVIVRSLGRKLIPIEREQPHIIIISPQGFTRKRAATVLETLTWEQVAIFVSSDYCQWQQPLALVSRFALISADHASFLVNAIVRGYPYLRRNLVRFLHKRQQSINFVNLDLKVFDHGWLITVGLLCVAVSIALSYGEPSLPARKILADGSTITVYLVATPLFRRFVTSFFLIYPVTLFSRLLVQRRALRKITGRSWETVPERLLWVAVLLQTLIASSWLLSAFFE